MAKTSSMRTNKNPNLCPELDHMGRHIFDVECLDTHKEYEIVSIDGDELNEELVSITHLIKETCRYCGKSDLYSQRLDYSLGKALDAAALNGNVDALKVEYRDFY